MNDNDTYLLCPLDETASVMWCTFHYKHNFVSHPPANLGVQTWNENTDWLLKHYCACVCVCVCGPCIYTGLFKMTVRVLTTCHTPHTWDGGICIFLFNRTLQVFVTYLTGALYVHPLWFYKHQHDNRVRSELFVACQRWWFEWRFWFVPSVPGYLQEEEEHTPLDPSVQLHTPISSVLCVTTPRTTLNNPV